MTTVHASFLSFAVTLVVAMFLWHQLIRWALVAKGLADRSPPDPIEVREKIVPVYFRLGATWFLLFSTGIVVVAVLTRTNWPLLSALGGAASVPLITALSLRDTLALIEKGKGGGSAA
jgi:hypothetical protein